MNSDSLYCHFTAQTSCIGNRENKIPLKGLRPIDGMTIQTQSVIARRPPTKQSVTSYKRGSLTFTTDSLCVLKHGLLQLLSFLFLREKRFRNDGDKRNDKYQSYLSTTSLVWSNTRPSAVKRTIYIPVLMPERSMLISP